MNLLQFIETLFFQYLGSDDKKSCRDMRGNDI